MLVRKGVWQPAKSGNPKGRPSIKGPVEALAREHTEEAVETLVELMRRGVPDAVKGAAANALLNRGWGLPRQVVEEAVKPVEQIVSCRGRGGDRETHSREDELVDLSRRGGGQLRQPAGGHRTEAAAN